MTNFYCAISNVTCYFLILDQPPPPGLISLSGSRLKRQNEGQRSGLNPKRPHLESQDVASSELLSRVETLLASNNLVEAEALIVSVLAHVVDYACNHSTYNPPIGGLGTSRTPGQSSRLPIAYTLGLLNIAKLSSGPSLFNHPAVLEQLFALLTVSKRIYRPNTTLVGPFLSKIRSINTLAANLLLVALSNQPKWPTKLVKLYLEDSFSDRMWVDLEECRAFVLNIETALPRVLGDPRGLFQVLSSPGVFNPSGAASSSASISSVSVQPLQTALGLTFPPGGAALSSTVLPPPCPQPAFAVNFSEAVTLALQTTTKSQAARVIQGGDLASLVLSRYETQRETVKELILSSVQEVLGRRASVGGSAEAPSLGSFTSLSAGGVGGGADNLRAPAIIRTLAMTAGLLEVRALAAQKLEPWFTNPKLQNLAVGLLAILTLNCQQPALFLEDLETMVTIAFRIRFNLFKPNLQAAVLENICRMAAVGDENLTILVRLCMDVHLPTISALTEPQEQQQQQQPTTTASATKSLSRQKLQQKQLQQTSQNQPSTPAGRCISETIRKITSGMQPEFASAQRLGALIRYAAEAGAKSTTPALIMPRLYQRFRGDWIKVVAVVLQERVWECITCPSASQITGHLPAEPRDGQLVAHTVRLLAPMRRFIRDMNKWTKNALAVTSSALSGAPITTEDILPYADLGTAFLMLDKNLNLSAEAVAQTLWQSSSGNGFGPFTILRYVYAVAHVICQLQMLSTTRINSSEAVVGRKKATSAPTAKCEHHACVVKLRQLFLRWFKAFVPKLLNSARVHIPSDAPRDAFAQIALLLRRVYFLEAAASFDQLAANSSPFGAFYAADDYWPGGEQTQRNIAYLLTAVNMPEKQLLMLLRHGRDSHLISPADTAIFASELIWRSAALAIEDDANSAEFPKVEEVVQLLFECCRFQQLSRGPAGDPGGSRYPQFTYNATYWRVTLALVALAAHSPNTCGSYLWLNYPTVRKCMEMVIKNEFYYNSSSDDEDAYEFGGHSPESTCQPALPIKMAVNEEQGVSAPSRSSLVVTPLASDVELPDGGTLVYGDPRGDFVQLPESELLELKRLCGKIDLRRRLCACRQPDFLLELVQSGNSSLPTRWVLQLVECLGEENIGVLPLHCLTDYLLHANIQRVRGLDQHLYVAGERPDQRSVAPTAAARSPHSSSCSSSPSDPNSNDDSERTGGHRSRSSSVVSPSTGNFNQHLCRRICKRMHQQMRASLDFDIPLQSDTEQSGSESFADAVLHSFAERLSFPSSLVRRASRYCLTLVATDDITNVIIPSPLPSASQNAKHLEDLLAALKRISSLPSMVITGTDRQPKVEPMDTDEVAKRKVSLLDVILNAIVVEDETSALTAYIVFLGHLVETQGFSAWRQTTRRLSQLLLTRPTLMKHLLGSTDCINFGPPVLSGSTRSPSNDEFRQTVGFVVLENLARMLMLDVDYYCTSVSVMPVNGDNSVLVEWAPGRQCPMDLEIIEAHLALLANIPRRFITASSPNTTWWGRVLNTWFISSAGNKNYSLPTVSAMTAASSETNTNGKARVGLGSEGKLALSAKLRSEFLVSTLPQLSSTAIADLSREELLHVIELTPARLLSPEKAAGLINLVADVQFDSLPLRQQLAIGALQAKAEQTSASLISATGTSKLAFSRLFTGPNLLAPHPPPPLLMSRKISSATATALSLVPRSAETFKTLSAATEERLWLGVVLRLAEAATDFTAQSQAFCHYSSTLNHSQALRSKWIQDLLRELQPTLSPMKRGRPASTSSTQTFTEMLKILGKNPTSVTYIYKLIRVCLEPDLSTTDVKHQQLCSVCLEALEKIGVQPIILANHVLKPIRSTISEIAKAEEPKPESSCSKGLDHSLCPMSISDVVSGQSTPVIEALEPALQRLVQEARDGEDSSLEATRKRCRYSLNELVHNTSLSVILKCMRSALRTDVRNLNSTVVLDLFSTVLNSPMFVPPVPFSEPQERPDRASLYAFYHRLKTPDEALRLLAHVCLEAASQASPTAQDHLLALRIALLDMPLQSYPQTCLNLVQSLAGFASLPRHMELPNDIAGLFERNDMQRTAKRLLLSLYRRRPGLLFELSAPAQRFLRAPTGSAEGIPDCFEQKEVNRLAPSLLIGFCSSKDEVRTSCLYSGIALATHHPRLCLPLLPTVASLSQGRLETSLTSSSGHGSGGGGTSVAATAMASAATAAAFGTQGAPATGVLSWRQFTERHHNDFYAGLLRFVEVLAFGSQGGRGSGGAGGVLFSPEARRYKECIEDILSSMVRVTTSYTKQAPNISVGYVPRLIRLLQAYTTSGLANSSTSPSSSLETALAWLVTTYPGSAQQLEPASTVALPGTSPAKRAAAKAAALLRHNRYQLKHSGDAVEVVRILVELETVTRNKVEHVVEFIPEIQNMILSALSCQDLASASALSHVDPGTQGILMTLLMRYLQHNPQHASAILGRVYTACLSRGAGGGLGSVALENLPEACLMVPHLAPEFLRAAALRLLPEPESRLPAPDAQLVTNAVCAALHRISLEGIFEASIEFAIMGLWRGSTRPKFLARGGGGNMET